VVKGDLVVGPNAITGEWGHNPLPAPSADELKGVECYCGRSGCIETFLSGRGLTLEYTKRIGEEHAVPEIVDRAAAGDDAAQAALDAYAHRLARALASVINILDPHVVVLGGGLSNLEYLYDAVPALWAPYVLSDTIETGLVRAEHGDSSVVRGAAWLW
jgi:fructokinase